MTDPVALITGAGREPGLGFAVARELAGRGFHELVNNHSTVPDFAATTVVEVDPEETATHPETGDEGDARPAAGSARGVVWAATLGAGGPSGGVSRDGAPLR